MSLGERLGGFLVKFFDDFVKDGLARLVAVDLDEEAEGLVVLQNGQSFFAEFLDAGAKDFDGLVVCAFAAVF